MPAVEVVNGPLDVYWAPVGEAFPAIDAAPAGNWALLGTSGDENYHEDGVVVNIGQETSPWTPLGSTIPKKTFRVSQELFVTLTMVDLDPAHLRVALNLNAVTVTVGPPATEEIDLDFGTTVDEMALLVRGTGKSPKSSGGTPGDLDFQINRAAEVSAHALTFVKNEPVGVEMEFRMMIDDSGNVGKILIATV